MKFVPPATIAFAVLFGQPASAGTYTVKDDGTGDFDSVQAAVIAVPEGSTLLLTGAFPEEVTITKSLRIVGGTLYDGPDFTHVVEILGADWVILDGLTIPSNLGGANNNYGHGILVQDVRFFALLNSTIHGQHLDSYWWGSCSDFGSGFDAVRLERVGYARITSCQLYGAEGTERYAFGDPGFCGDYDIAGGVGGAGLWVDQSFVVVEDTIATGGDGGDAAWNDWVGLNQPPNSLTGGDGGDGVHGSVGTDGCTFLGGAAGTWEYTGTNWGIGIDGNPGSAVRGVATPFVLPELVAVTDLVLGKPATLSGQGFATSSIALLFVAPDVDPPLAIRQGSWMLEPPWVYLAAVPTDGTGSFALQANVPNNPSLVALLFFLQAGDVTTLSEPQELIFSD